ncbi:MAG: VOC family protein [Cyanobacteria bacterium J06628_6]
MGLAGAVCNLLVIRSLDIERVMLFYQRIGLSFVKHAHGTGPEHYTSEVDRFVFEIYPACSDGEVTRQVRIGFEVGDVDAVFSALVEVGAVVRSKPANSQWGRRAVVQDFEGRLVELLTPAVH